MKKLGRSTVVFENPPSIKEFFAIVGEKEGQGPLKDCFDSIVNDPYVAEKSFEAAEAKLQKLAVSGVLEKASLKQEEIDIIFAGDLLNQCIGSTFGISSFQIPFVGLYGACSTMAESLCLASVFAAGGIAAKAIAVTSSHFCSAERQFRLPLEYGGQRPPSAQWTVTGSGAMIVEAQGTAAPFVRGVTFGTIEDYLIKDVNNMGAAMAPAACKTIKAHLDATGASAADFDLIVTGDLGKIGGELLCQLMREEGMDISSCYNDCGMMIFDIEKQDVHSGGSGCGCSATVMCAHILQRIRSGELKRILFAATGALMSPTSTMQGQSIPAICHVAEISNTKV